MTHFTGWRREGGDRGIVAHLFVIRKLFLRIGRDVGRLESYDAADAILDRLVHNAYRLQLVGDSQRKLRAIRSMPNP